MPSGRQKHLKRQPHPQMFPNFQKVGQEKRKVFIVLKQMRPYQEAWHRPSRLLEWTHTSEIDCL